MRQIIFGDFVFHEFSNNTGFYLPWTEWSGCFKSGNAETRARNRSCSTVGQCRHLGENVQHEMCKSTINDDDEDDDDGRCTPLYKIAHQHEINYTT